MTLWQATVLGLIQGLTEYLPVSSTAHLRIIPAFLGWGDPGAAFTAVIQLGTLAAVIIYFARDIVQIIKGSLRGISTPEGKLGWMIAGGTVPVVVFGLMFKKHIEHNWRSLYVIAGAMIGLAIVLGIAEWFEKRRQRLRAMDELGWLDAIVVGLFQAVALVPGSSRSGCTIAGGLFLGMKRDTAARFSFLLSLPAVFAAGVFELWHARHELLATRDHVHDLIVATVVSFVVGYASIAFLISYLRRHTTWVFIGYRIVLGVALLVGLNCGCGKPSEEKAPAPAKAAVPADPFAVVMGRWLRMDGGYMLMVHSVEAGGKAVISYRNPSPIHVEQAQVSREGDVIKIFVELRDEGYPGCTYRLRYEPLRDQLVGVYYQAALKESYEINFERQR